jgi:hypothetical protein
LSTRENNSTGPLAIGALMTPLYDGDSCA